MQTLWGRILSGEANVPGSHSKRVIDFLSTISKAEVDDFTRLCKFAWMLGPNLVLLIYDYNAEVYTKNGITFDILDHLDSIGLIKFNYLSSFARVSNLPGLRVHYYGRPMDLKLTAKKNDGRWQIQVGCASLTKIGLELAPICGSAKSDEFFEFVLSKWHDTGIVPSCPLPAR